MGPDAASTSSLPPDRTTATRGRRSLLSEVLPSSTAMTGLILGRQLDPETVAALLVRLDDCGALVRSEGTSASFQLDRCHVVGGRPYAQVASSTTVALAALAHQGLLVEVSLFRGHRETFRGRFEEPHPIGDLVSMVDGDVCPWRVRRARFAHALVAAGRWVYSGLQLSGAGFGLPPVVRAPDDPGDRRQRA
jgi:hypothetical protein